MKSRIERFAFGYVTFADKFKWLLLLVALLITASSVWYTTSNLKLNNNLAILLPEHTPSVIALKESEERFGSSDKFLIVVQGKDPVAVAQAQDSVKANIEANWKDIALSVQVERDNQFFVDHALIYLPVSHLERIRDNLENIQGQMGLAANPFAVDLVSGNTEKKELVWFESSIPEELGLPDEAASAFEGYYKTEAQKEADGNNKKAEFDKKAGIPPHLKNRMMALSERDQVYNGVVFVKLTQPPTNINFSGEVLARSAIIIDKYKAIFPELRMSVEGSYEGLKQVKAMKMDGIVSAVISLLLILGIVTLFFRSIWSAALLVSQVSFASALMLFFTTIVYGQLNLYTLFVAAIILGMGIDFSIHFMGTAQRYQNKYKTIQEALAHTIIHLAYPMFLAALTTIAGMLTLLIAEFSGFYEFGVITAMGIALSFGAAMLGLPVLILLVGGLPKKTEKSIFPAAWSESKIAKVVSRTGFSVLIISLLLVSFFPWAEFENDFRNLREQKKQVLVKNKKPKFNYGEAMASNRKSSQPALVIADTPEELNKLYDTLMHRKNVDKDPYLKSFLTIKTFVPEEEEQEERLEVIEEIKELIEARAFDRADSSDLEMIQKLRGMVDVESFEASEIPEWALSILREKDGTIGSIGYIYGKYNSWDAEDMLEFQNRYGTWNFGDRDLRIFSTAFITSDVITAVKEDSFKMAIFISIVRIISLGVSLRDRKMLLISVASLGLGAVWTIGLMGLTNVMLGLGKVGIFNVIVIPTALGVGIDATIHLLISFTSHKNHSLRQLYDTTGKMVMASSLTTAGGFVGVLFISHNGMRTIGELAVIGIIATMITALTITPWLSYKLFKKDSK